MIAFLYSSFYKKSLEKSKRREKDIVILVFFINNSHSIPGAIPDPEGAYRG